MHHVVDISALGLSILSLVGLVILGALASALASTGYRLLQFTWWLRDVDGPPSHSFPFGHYADFFAKDIVETCLGWMDQYGSAVRHMSFFGVRLYMAASPFPMKCAAMTDSALAHLPLLALERSQDCSWRTL